MNLIGTALERSEQNKYYMEFKTKNPEISNDEYEWKCWMLKKYFKDNLVVNFCQLIGGVFLLIFGCSSSLAKIFGNTGLKTILFVLCLFFGAVFLGTGIMYTFSNYKCLKNYKDHLWDEEGEIVEKIIKFYNRGK